MKNLTMKNTLFATSIVAAGFAGTMAAYAATADGTTGATSNGTFDVDLTIENKLKISNLVKIDMGTFNGGPMSGNQTFCAFFNQGNAAKYQLTFDSLNAAGGPFALAVGGNNILYTLDVDDNDGNTVTGISDTTPAAGLSVGPNFSTDDDCGGGTNNNLTITANSTKADIEAAGANGTYTDEVSILMEPDFTP